MIFIYSFLNPHKRKIRSNSSVIKKKLIKKIQDKNIAKRSLPYSNNPAAIATIIVNATTVIAIN